MTCLVTSPQQVHLDPRYTDYELPEHEALVIVLTSQEVGKN